MKRFTESEIPQVIQNSAANSWIRPAGVPFALAPSDPAVDLYYKMAARVKELEKRSWSWVQAKDFTEKDRSQFLEYFDWAKKDVARRNKLLDTLPNSGTKTRTLADFPIDPEFKFIFGNPHFPLELLRDFAHFINQKANPRFQHAFDSKFDSEFKRIEGLGKRFEKDPHFSVRETAGQNVLLSAEKIYFVFHKLMSVVQMDQTQDPRIVGQTYYNPSDDFQALSNSIDAMRTEEGRKVAQVFRVQSSTKENSISYLAFKSFSGDQTELERKIGNEFKCDPEFYHAIGLILLQENRNSHLPKLLNCPLDFLKGKNAWKSWISGEILETKLEQETDPVRKQFFLKIYEEKKTVVFN